ncbi:mucin-5AC isoform X2 [Eurytemora carolleeae]|uniref:mucin-5AC isoform X2 n=1 Tax=Eurytemora carolleeae TaxID=1294199 RepID=UPI000C78054F|nr:mucin-5AC isoform X2 [Eurytemora carolleeae]|eukprot:XP_023343749.1 mucin-5AC-like isoform X2 [Eurytemora affinis]
MSTTTTTTTTSTTTTTTRRTSVFVPFVPFFEGAVVGIETPTPMADIADTVVLTGVAGDLPHNLSTTSGSIKQDTIVTEASETLGAVTLTGAIGLPTIPIQEESTSTTTTVLPLAHASNNAVLPTTTKSTITTSTRKPTTTTTRRWGLLPINITFRSKLLNSTSLNSTGKNLTFLDEFSRFTSPVRESTESTSSFSGPKFTDDEMRKLKPKKASIEIFSTPKTTRTKSAATTKSFVKPASKLTTFTTTTTTSPSTTTTTTTTTTSQTTTEQSSTASTPVETSTKGFTVSSGLMDFASTLESGGNIILSSGQRILESLFNGIFG